jgi:hypothetical protein
MGTPDDARPRGRSSFNCGRGCDARGARVGWHRKEGHPVPVIACLHTAESNVSVFDLANRELGSAEVALRHCVRPELLAAAERAGGLTAVIRQQTVEALRALSRDVDAVLLTCSTLGPAAPEAGLGASAPILRVDAALAREAMRDGDTVVVLCAAETTLEATRCLFEEAARANGANVIARVVPGAWDSFKAGDQERYVAMIAGAAEDAYRSGASRVALAQASMAGASKIARSKQVPLTSPLAGLRAAVEAAHSR